MSHYWTLFRGYAKEIRLQNLAASFTIFLDVIFNYDNLLFSLLGGGKSTERA